jgi:N-acetylneuraminic acid mutarotase
MFFQIFKIMYKTYLISLTILLLTNCKKENSTNINGNWTNIADFGGGGKRGSVSFTIGSDAFIVSGMGNSFVPDKQVWKYNATTDKWTKMNEFSGLAFIEGTAFSIGLKGYVCMGSQNNSAGAIKDLWEYDPLQDKWIKKSEFPGSPRSGLVSAVAREKAYIFGGSSAEGLQKDIWEYDPANDKWTQKADFPGTGKFLPTIFQINDKIYFGLGGIAGNTFTSSKDFWEYDTQNDSWTQKSDFPGSARGYAIGYSLNNKGYLCAGLLGILNNGNTLSLEKDLWEYIPSSDSWEKLQDIPSSARSMCIGFAIGNDLYIGAGTNSSNQNLTDFWKFTP